MIRLAATFTLLVASPISGTLAMNPAKEVESKVEMVSDPVVAVQSVYEENWKRGAMTLPMTQRLESLFLLERDHLKASGEPIGRLDFDWTVNGQDASISMLDITAIDVPMRDFGDEAVDQFERRIVTARFMNFDSEQIIRYYWVKQRNGWHLDDVMGQGEDSMTWTLSLILGFGG